MRLRLRIERNELPAVNLLWPVSPTQQQNTIAQLLESIDKVIPLETDTWGLDDYIVAVGGYECLQFHEVSAVCNPDDEVVIRPRTWAETRARTLLGRSSITEDGRHLEDGVAFGRVALRAPVRPEVRIPEKKRKRGAEEGGEGTKRVRFTGDGEYEGGYVEEEDDDDEEDDEDFELPEETAASVSQTSSSSDSDSSSAASSSDSDASSESESESDSGPSTGSRSSGSSLSSDSSSDSSSDGESMGDSDEADWSGISSSPSKSKRTKAAAQASAHVKQPSKLANGHVSAKKSHIVAPERPSQDSEERRQAPPGTGKKQTQDRNQRRRDSKRLRYLQSIGALPMSASLATVHEWQRTNHVSKSAMRGWTARPLEEKEMEKEGQGDTTMTNGPGDIDTTSDDAAKTPAPKPVDRMKSMADLTSGGVENGGPSYSEQQRGLREKLLADLASGGVEVGSSGKDLTVNEMDAGPEEMSSKIQDRSTAVSVTDGASSRVDTAQNGNATVGAKENATESSSRRSKLDSKSAQRLLFGSLGVRVPKTQAQKDALQKKLAGETRKPVVRPVVAAEPRPEPATEAAAPEDPDAWWDKIDLRAVECCDENVTLSTPPYPFFQRWDPQYRGKKNRNMNAYAAGKRKRKRNHADDYGGFEETYDKYNITGEGDFLDYGEDDEYWEEGALMGDDGDEEEEEDPAARQLQAEASATAKLDNFPPLPTDLSTLPSVSPADTRLGDYLVYTALVCSPATKWQPSMVPQSVQLREKVADVGDHNWKITVALRDLPAKQFDDDGNRVYEKFEMEGASDDEGNEGEEDVKVLNLSELSELKLLGRSDAGADAGAGAEVAEAS